MKTPILPLQKPQHPIADLFEHFLGYSNLYGRETFTLAELRMAYEHGPGPRLTRAAEKRAIRRVFKDWCAASGIRNKLLEPFLAETVHWCRMAFDAGMVSHSAELLAAQYRIGFRAGASSETATRARAFASGVDDQRMTVKGIALMTDEQAGASWHRWKLHGMVVRSTC